MADSVASVKQVVMEIDPANPPQPWGLPLGASQRPQDDGPEARPVQLRMQYRRGLSGLPAWTVPPGCQLRPYRPDDDAGLRVLLRLAGFADRSQEARYAQLIGQPEAREGTRVIACSGRLVAVSFAGRYDDVEGRLDYVCGHPEHRGKGLGLGVCVAVTRFLLEQGYATVALTTDDWRLPAIRTYVKIGFEPVLFRWDMPERWARVYGALAAAAAARADLRDNMARRD
ncbi:MAG: GNAT family N-acetyltransferase [Actinobacteria bacterium]|nr:GNAT family N-acetyltransferase [Actinomycetota bacterium]